MTKINSKAVHASDSKGRKQFGLITGLTLIIGSVIGIGIFFKNKSVMDSTGIGWMSIVAWLIGGLLTLSMAMSFAEISSLPSRSNAGISRWAKAFVNNTYGRVVAWAHLVFYFPLNMVAVAFYVGKFAVSVFLPDTVNDYLQENTWLIFLLTAGLLTLVMVINAYLIFGAKIIQTWGTLIKFAPIMVAVVGGILIYPYLKGGNSFSGFNYSPKDDIANKTNGYQPGPNQKNIIGLFMALPPILFALDSFLAVGNVTRNMRNPKRNVPLTIILGMTIIVVVYVLVSMGVYAIDHVADTSTARPGELPWAVGEMFGGMEWLSSLIVAFVVVSAFVVLNGMCISIIRLADSMIREKEIMGANLLNKMKKGKEDSFTPSFVIIMILNLGWTFLLFGAGGFQYNASDKTSSDSLIDTFSNVPVLVFFLVYASVIAGGFINRFTKKITVIKKQPWFFVTAPLSVVFGAFVVVFYFVILLKNLDFSSWDAFTGKAAGSSSKGIEFILDIVSAIICSLSIINIKVCNKRYGTHKMEPKNWNHETWAVNE